MSAIHSSRFDYALRSLFELARRYGMGPIRIIDVADAQGIPARFLEAIFADMRRAGLVESKRGVKGGYWLARSPDRVRVSDVLTEIDGDLLAVPGEPGVNGSREAPASAASIKRLWSHAERAIASVYQETTLADLVVADREAQGLHGGDYMI
jgi:Rrf2 family transcriptional regulator, cysteine metabolism repressor